MKKLYWIDDGIEGVRQLADKIIYYLWGLNNKEHIVSQVFIFKFRKNNSRLKETEKIIESDVYTLIEKDAKNKLAERDADDYTELNEWKKEYIEGKFKFVLYNETNKDLNEFYKKLVDCWGPLSSNTITEQHLDFMKKFIDSLSIDDNSVIGIDICLFATADRDRVMYDKPVLAYYLYQELKSRGHQCFLYSLDLDNSTFKDKVKAFLSNSFNYGDEDIKLYITQEIVSNGGSDFLNEVRKMCREGDAH